MQVAWKNGGGTTREIAVLPPGAGMDEFLWRLSVARVERAGSFSAFDGVDRVLYVLDGTLHLTGEGFDIRMTNASPPCYFDGGVPVMGTPLGGPVLGLNAMARRGKYGVKMTRLRPGDVASDGSKTFFLALNPQFIAGILLDRPDCAVLSAPVIVEGYGVTVDFNPQDRL